MAVTGMPNPTDRSPIIGSPSLLFFTLKEKVSLTSIRLELLSLNHLGFLILGSNPSTILVSLHCSSLPLFPLIGIAIGTILCRALPGLQISILCTNIYSDVREDAWLHGFKPLYLFS